MKKLRETYREVRKTIFGGILLKDFVEPKIDPEILLPDAVSLLTKAIADHITTSKHVRDYVIEIKKGEGQYCPDSPIDEIIKYLAIQNGQIDKSDAAVNINFLDSMIFPIFDFERQQFAKLFESNFDATPEERLLFSYSIELGELIDELYYHWFKRIVVDYQMLNVDEKKSYEKLLGKTFGIFDYTVYNYGFVYPDKTEKVISNRRAWAIAFPTVIREIVSVLNKMAELYPKIGIDGLVQRNYYLALAKAYECRDIEKLEEAWAEVDKAWIQIPTTCRLIPIHGMENQYEHPFGVSPEFKLSVRTNYGKTMISQARNASPNFARKIRVENYLVQLAEKKLTNLDMGVFAVALKSGVCANFRSAGQVIPNRQDILNEGGKIFMDIDSSSDMVKTYRGLLIDNCEPEMGNKLSGLIKTDSLLTHTAGHECSHPIGCTKASDLILGETKGRLEEAKATIGGIATILDSMPISDWPEVVALCIARVCRFFKKTTFENPTLQPYVRENLVMANLLITAKIVSVKSLTETALEVNLSERNFYTFSELLTNFYRNVVDGYHSMAPIERINDMEGLYCFQSKDIQNWIALVNKSK